MTELYYPLRSLRDGHWFKLICGASFQHLPAIRNLVLAYALAGADCIDVAADPAVVSAARAALKLASDLANSDLANSDGGGRSHLQGTPWLMVSLNDGEDPHFRKAEFDPMACPPDCVRPCEFICPAKAIVFDVPDRASDDTPDFGIMPVKRALNGAVSGAGGAVSGVLSDRCYGCGRCLPVCPIQQISTRSYLSTPAAIAPLVLSAGVDALEIHTQIGHVEDFRQLWQAITPWLGNLKLVAISCPDGDGLLDYLWALYDIVSPLPCPLLWQMDGRPMSGDLGMGATRAAVKLGQKAVAAGLPGYIQLAGGTNHHTVPKLKALGLLHPALLRSPSHWDLSHQDGAGAHGAGAQWLDESDVQHHTSAYVAGVAYGSYARSLLAPLLEQLDPIAEQNQFAEVNPIAEVHQPARSSTAAVPSPLASIATSDRATVGHRQASWRSQPLGLEDSPDLLWQAVTLAHTLVSQLKPFDNRLKPFDSRQRTRLNL